MRVLLVTDNYPPIIGGGQIQSRVLAQSLHARGHDVVVATVWQHGVPAAERDDGVSVFRLRQLRTLPIVARKWRHHQPPFPDPVTTVGLRRLIARFRPDIVHSYGWYSYSCAAALLGKNIPLVLTARDYAYSCATRTLMYRGRTCTGPALMKCLGCAAAEYGRPKGWITALGVFCGGPLLRRKVRAVHSISTYVGTIMNRDFLDARHSMNQKSGPVMHSTINDMIADTDGEPGSGPNDELSRLGELPREPFMLFVGGLRRVKGLDQLFAAYDTLTDAPPLVLIGTLERDSPEFPPGIRVLTDFPHRAVMAAWDRCLFAVLPSLLPEPFGTVVCEAMSRGKAVIGTVPGGHSDMIVHGESGLLVPAGDVQALAHAMHQLISDGALRERLGRAARLRAQRFTVETTIPRIEQLYERLVERSAPAT